MDLFRTCMTDNKSCCSWSEQYLGQRGD